MLTLLDGLHAAGATIQHHGDEDQAGVKILEYLTERVRATRWRVEAATEPEELVLGALLEDLRRGG